MSKKNKQSNSLSQIRRRLHNRFETNSLVTEIIFSCDDEIKITERKNTDTNKLKTVIINNLNTGKISETIRIKKMWQVNLETMIQENKLALRVSQQSSTCECALIILTKSDQDEYYNMNICLIELKNNINNSDDLRMFKQLVGKISSNMNIMYLFLTLNNHNNHNNPDKGYEGKDIKVNFKGIIFYNKATINENQDQFPSPTDLPTERNLLDILLKRNSEYNPLVIKTFLNDKDTIGIKFFKNPNEDTDEMEVSIQDLIT
jgi:hypothetical protein